MHREKYWRSKIPLGLVLLFLLNLFVIGGLELLLMYQTPLPLTEDTLCEWDSAYDGCTVLQEVHQNQLWCYLVRTDSDEIHLIPIKANGVFHTRGRIYSKEIQIIPEPLQETSYNIKIGIRTSTVTVSPEPIPYMETQAPSPIYIAISYAASSGAREASTLYMVLAAILEGLELALWQLLKGRNT